MDEGCWQEWAVQEEMPCLKVLSDPGKQCVVDLSSFHCCLSRPGDAQAEGCKLGCGGTVQAGVLVILLRVLLLRGQLRGLLGDMGLGK